MWKKIILVSSFSSLLLLSSTTVGHFIKLITTDKEKYPPFGKFTKNFDVETHYLTNFNEEEKKPSVVFVGDLGETIESFVPVNIFKLIFSYIMNWIR